MTTTDNKLIADFMNSKISENNYFINGMYKEVNNLKYDTNWNWLMEVVEKIENTKIDNTIFDVFITKDKTHIHYSKNNEWFSNIFLHEGNNKLENTYNACIEFIKWYNK